MRHMWRCCQERLSLPCVVSSDDGYEEARQILAANVRRLRKARGMTQESAAHEIGIVPRHFQKLEAGELNITLHTLCKVASALRVGVAELFANLAAVD